jgi:hypothetical protein
MTQMIRFFFLFGTASILSFAANVSGWLVNSQCFARLENNQRQPKSFVDWDRNLAIRYCSPNKHSTSFAVVGDDGRNFRFDLHGNEKALDLHVNADNTSMYFVNAIGQIDRHTIDVLNLTISKRFPRSGKGAPGW